MLIQVICKNCEKTFNKRETEIKKSPNHYCSKSCAAKVNNKIPKRKKTNIRFCKKCNISLVDSRCLLCSECFKNRTWRFKTLKSFKDRRNHQVYSQIREVARNIFWKNNPNAICLNCGYSKHIEVCHKKAINSYSDDTLIGEINDLNNLVGLCPNCHWEFDNGLLII